MNRLLFECLEANRIKQVAGADYVSFSFLYLFKFCLLSMHPVAFALGRSRDRSRIPSGDSLLLMAFRSSWLEGVSHG